MDWDKGHFNLDTLFSWEISIFVLLDPRNVLKLIVTGTGRE